MINSYFFLITVTILYCFLHSLLADTKIKAYLKKRGGLIFRYYRMLYNAFACASLIPILVIMHSTPGNLLWNWPYPLVMNMIFLCAILLFLYTLKFYDTKEFLGITTPNNSTLNNTTFVISPLHRYVRHPWYFLALIVIWSRDLTTSYFIVASIFSVYFAIGSLLEEKKLILQYGKKYQLYRANVPGLFPIPFKYLKNETLDIIKKTK